MAKLVPNFYAALVLVLFLTIYARIAVSDGYSSSSSSSYSSSNYGGLSSNDAYASRGGDDSFPSEENQYDTTPTSGGEGDSPNTYYETQYAYPPYEGADDSSTAGDVTYASPPVPDMSSAPSSETVPNNSEENYKDESQSYDESSSSYSYPPSSSSSGNSSSSSSNDDTSSSSSTWEEDSPSTTTAEGQSSTEETYNSVKTIGSRVDSTETKTERSGSKVGLAFGVLIGVCAVGAAGFVYIKKKRESYLNTNRYISLTRRDRI